MALPTTLSASKLSIWIGDSMSPGLFVSPCGLTTKGIQFTANANDVTVPDCDNPDAPAWVGRVVESLSAGISGSGVLAMEALATWRAFFFNATAVMCRVVIDDGAGVLGGHFDGLMLCTNFNITGTQGEKIQVEITTASDGAMVWTTGNPG
jgi:predicted secreted protein